MRFLFITGLLCFLVNENRAQNVGIGTTSPAAKLEVKTNLNYVLQLNGAAPVYAGIFENDVYRGYFGSYSGAAEDVDFGTGTGNTSGKLHFTIQSVPKLTIDAAGNVGIGLTNPGARLDVAGQIKISGGSPGAGKVLTSNASGLATWETPPPSLWTVSGSNIYNSNAENVGIGVSNPIGKLEVDAGNLSETSVRFKSSSDYGIRHWYMMGNELNSALVVARFGPLLLGNLFGLPTPNLSAIYTNDLGVNALAIGTKNNIPLVLGTNNAERMRIEGNGSVGIGVSPSSFVQLHVRRAGDFSAAPLGEFGAIYGENGNLNTGSGVYGISSSPRTGANGFAGVTGFNGSAGTDRFGVIGTSSGTSVANALSAGVGGYGDYGVLGSSQTNTGAGMIAQHSSGKTALEINNGFIKVSGTNKTAFTVTGTAGNTSGHILSLSYANPAATDIVLAIHNYNPGGLGGTYHNNAVGVYWTGTTWSIYSEDNTTPMLGKSFNVLVIKQ